MKKYDGITVRKIAPAAGTDRFNPLTNTLRKEDFKAFVAVLKDSLQKYLKHTKETSLIGLNSLVEAALKKAKAHKAIRVRVSAKVKENSSSKAALQQYLYNFILLHEAAGTIDTNIKVK